MEEEDVNKEVKRFRELGGKLMEQVRLYEAGESSKDQVVQSIIEYRDVFKQKYWELSNKESDPNVEMFKEECLIPAIDEMTNLLEVVQAIFNRNADSDLRSDFSLRLLRGIDLDAFREN